MSNRDFKTESFIDPRHRRREKPLLKAVAVAVGVLVANKLIKKVLKG